MQDCQAQAPAGLCGLAVAASSICDRPITHTHHLPDDMTPHIHLRSAAVDLPSRKSGAEAISCVAFYPAIGGIAVFAVQYVQARECQGPLTARNSSSSRDQLETAK